MPLYQFKRRQYIDASIERVWEFISSPRNLKEITPSNMNFEITNPTLAESVFQGMIINYRLNIIPFLKSTWVSEITHVKDGEYFVDEQREGPYSMWHHQHLITPVGNRVLMEDIVSYRPPFGLIGAFFNRIFIKRKLNQIFDYRKKALDKKFVKLRAVKCQNETYGTQQIYSIH